MTKDQAIEELAYQHKHLSPTVKPEFKAAIKLGEEALLQVKDCCSGEVLSPDFRLPSETKAS